MRRALRFFSTLTAVLACACAVLGVLALRLQRLGLVAAEGGGIPPEGGLETAHALAGHAAALVSCAAASLAFLLGLHGLLETGGRRAPAAVFFVLGPLLMGLALKADLTGLRGWREVPPALAAAEHDAFVAGHVVVPGGGFVLVSVALAVAAWTLAKPDRRQGSEDEDGGDPDAA